MARGTVDTCEHCCTRLEKVSVSLGGQAVLQEIDLHLNCGQLIALVGPNGAGKTTLLKAILGEVPFTGHMHFQVRGGAGKRPLIGYVPQKLNFDPDTPVSVRDFFAASISRRPIWSGASRRLRQQIRTLLGYVSAGELRDRRLGELSGGELQRVLLAMAMTPAPDLLLLDEPATGVDVQGLQLFYQMVEAVKTRHDISILMVTHDLAGVTDLADRLVLINRKVVAEGRPRAVLADRQVMQTFGPGLWNISRLPFTASGETGPGSVPP